MCCRRLYPLFELFRAFHLYHSSVTPPAEEVRDWVWHRMLAACLKKDAVAPRDVVPASKVAMAKAVATFNGPWIVRWVRGLGRNVSRMSIQVHAEMQSIHGYYWI